MTETITIWLESPTFRDRQFMFELANDPVTRGQSFSAANIPWDRHCEWFANWIHNPKILKWIVTWGKQRVGVVWCEKREKDAIISVNMLPEFRGAGLGTQTIRMASEHAAIDWNCPITAYVKPTNLASIGAFHKAGYTDVGDTKVGGCAAKELRFEYENR